MDDCSESVVGDGRVGEDFGDCSLGFGVLTGVVFFYIFRQIDDFVFQGISSG